MHSMIGWGIAVVVFAAILNGSFAAPIKRMTGWQWENSWLLFAFSGLLVFPWIVTFATVPNLEEGFRRSIVRHPDSSCALRSGMGHGRYSVRARDQPSWHGARIRSDPRHHRFIRVIVPIGDSSSRTTLHHPRPGPDSEQLS